MKKNLIIAALALLIALPVYSLAAEAAALPEGTQAVALGGQFGRRWNQTAPQAQQQPAFADENKDGVCDLCGNVQGTNKEAPGFVDADGDGVCDNLGTAQQYQGRMGSTRGMGRGQKGQQTEGQNFGGGRNRR